MVNYTLAIKRPFTDFKKLLLGILFSLIPIVNFIAVGYQLECGKTSMKKVLTLPNWKNNIWNYFLNGIKSIIILIVYSIPVLIVLAISIGVNIPSFIKSLSTTGAPNISTLLSFGSGIFIAIILAAIIAYIAPMAVLNFINNWTFNDAFKFKEVFRKVLTKKYFLAWIITIGYGILIGTVGSLIPFVGATISGFIAAITQYTILGEVYTEIK